MQGGVISIGNFDGVHKGHAVLLNQVTQLAKADGAPTIAVIFDPHPAAILRPDRIPPQLTWIERRAELLDRLGIDYLLVCETSRELLNLTAEQFFQNLIVDRLRAKAIVEGPNFFFGRGRGGNIQTLEQLCRQHEIQLTIAEPMLVDGEWISSTRIRNLLADGMIEQANELLGVPHRVRGTVTRGEQRGRQIGFPTANLTDIDVVVPGPGVYGGFVPLGAQTYLAAIHIGPNPTFSDDAATKVEVHLLDYSADLYDAPLIVDFVTAVRDIARFDSAEQLSEQLARDVNTIRNHLTTNHSADDNAGT
ncbi:MAG: bifunctional riboflavin kinase/FAD synthetase [Pirellulaceae bacterium]|nr:bifunctional riboflavin kinase/FAD synthetase [Pirellulaceae bacterium]